MAGIMPFARGFLRSKAGYAGDFLQKVGYNGVTLKELIPSWPENQEFEKRQKP